MPKPMLLPTQSDLLSLFNYDPETGILTWKRRHGDPRKVGAHNARFAGRPAGNIVKRCRTFYLTVQIDGGPRYAHRVAYKIATGEEPDLIDHINGDGLDNRLSNLRAADARTNQGNRRHNRRSSSGIKGVSQVGSRFVARITKSGRYVHLGTFPTIEEAQRAYATAAEEYFGEYADPRR